MEDQAREDQARDDQARESGSTTAANQAGAGTEAGDDENADEAGHTEVVEPQSHEVAESQPHEVMDTTEDVTGSPGQAQPGQAQPGQAESSGAEVDKAAADTIARLQQEVASMHEQVLRTHAEMQNFRRRAEKDVANAHKFALDKFVADLVNVVDNLERAITTIDRDNEACKALGEGVELTLKGFLDILRRFNVEQVDPKGQSFNPELHQAMTMVPNPDLAPNTVMEVFQKGYLLNGRLVRPAMVVVSRGTGGQ